MVAMPSVEERVQELTVLFTSIQVLPKWSRNSVRADKRSKMIESTNGTQ